MDCSHSLRRQAGLRLQPQELVDADGTKQEALVPWERDMGGRPVRHLRTNDVENGAFTLHISEAVA